MMLDQVMDLRNGVVRLCYNKDYVCIHFTMYTSLYPQYEVYRGYIAFAFSVIIKETKSATIDIFRKKKNIFFLNQL